jgi:hypothetical protein
MFFEKSYTGDMSHIFLNIYATMVGTFVVGLAAGGYGWLNKEYQPSRMPSGAEELPVSGSILQSARVRASQVGEAECGTFELPRFFDIGAEREVIPDKEGYVIVNCTV